MTTDAPSSDHDLSAQARAWLACLRSVLADHTGQHIEAPAQISDLVLARSGYIANFPHQIVSLPDSPGTYGMSLTPAACLHVYPRLQGAEIGYVTQSVHAPCTRYERGQWLEPYRLYHFHMLELVVLGSEGAVEAARPRITATVASLFHSLGLGGRLQDATDAFFMGSSSGARMIQALKGLKREYQVDNVSGPVALASFNYHENYFGRCFDIRSAGAPAHSFCAAFGLERLATYSAGLWGTAVENWPPELKVYGQVS